MITIYTESDKIPSGKNVIYANDDFFDIETANLVGGQRDLHAIKTIDRAEPDVYAPYFRTPFGVARPENFSTGCKTVLNILHHPDKVFSTIECGDNVLSLLFTCDGVTFYCPVLPFYPEFSVPISIDGFVVNTLDEYIQRRCDLYEAIRRDSE